MGQLEEKQKDVHSVTRSNKSGVVALGRKPHERALRVRLRLGRYG